MDLTVTLILIYCEQVYYRRGFGCNPNYVDSSGTAREAKPAFGFLLQQRHQRRKMTTAKRTVATATGTPTFPSQIEAL